MCGWFVPMKLTSLESCCNLTERLITLDVKAIHSVRFDKFLRLVIGDDVGDDVQTSGYYASILLVSSHCESFNAASNTIC